jgi:c-di-GMP-binding flagellar brake protein YcgR
MDRIKDQERRQHKRYSLALPMRYRVTPRRGLPLTGTGTTCDISEAGVGFLCREALPEGSHIEVVAQWPARCADGPPLDLRMTGFVTRSNQVVAAALVTSHKLCADKSPVVLPFRASA